jgi:Icc protein
MAGALVLQLSDTHFTASPEGEVNDLDPAARLERVLAAWDTYGLRADLVLLTGDNADDGSLAACRRLAATVEKLDVPVFAIAGNHDAADSVTVAFGAAQEIEVGAWRVIGVGSEVPGRTEGEVDVAETLGRVDRLDSRPTVVAVHHPPVGTSTHPWFQLGGAGELLAGLAARPHVRAVVSGHLHEAFEFSGPAGLSLLGSPSTLYALQHTGDLWEKAPEGITGGRLIRLFDDGSLSSELVIG